MGSRGIRGQKTPDVVPLPTKERVLFMQRLLGKYYAEKGYAVSRECGIPTLLEDTDGTVRERIGNPQRADFIAVNKKRTEVVIVETKSGPADFLADDKWRNYFRNCTKFYFACDRATALYIEKVLTDDPLMPYVGLIVLAESPDVPAYQLEPWFMKPARKRKLGVPVAELLWRMAARNSGFSWMGELESGNSFEHRKPLSLETAL